MKLRAPDHVTGPFSHKGRRLEIAEDRSIEIPDPEAAALAAHGFTPWASERSSVVSVDALSRDELAARVMDATASLIARMTTDDLRRRLQTAQRKSAQPIDEREAAGVFVDAAAIGPVEVERMNRAELFAYLRAERIRVAPPIRNEELRALARSAFAAKQGAE